MVVITCVYRYVFGAEIITIGDSGTAAVLRRLEDPGQIGKAMDFGGGCQPRLRMDAVATRSWFLQCERRVVLFPRAGQCCCLSTMCPVGKGRVSARRLPDIGVYCLSFRKGTNYRACEIPRTYTRPSTTGRCSVGVVRVARMLARERCQSATRVARPWAGRSRDQAWHCILIACGRLEVYALQLLEGLKTV